MRRLAMVLVVFSGMLFAAGIASADHRRAYGHCAPPRYVPPQVYYHHHIPHALPHHYRHYQYYGHNPYRAVPGHYGYPYGSSYSRYNFGYHGNQFSLHFGF